MTLPSYELDAAQEDVAPLRTSELIYCLEDCPSLPQMLFAIGQTYVGNVCVGGHPAALLIC